MGFHVLNFTINVSHLHYVKNTTVTLQSLLSFTLLYKLIHIVKLHAISIIKLFIHFMVQNNSEKNKLWNSLDVPTVIFQDRLPFLSLFKSV